jgi:hypothetical protein
MVFLGLLHFFCVCKSWQEKIKYCNLNPCVLQIAPGISSIAKGLKKINSNAMLKKKIIPFCSNIDSKG